MQLWQVEQVQQITEGRFYVVVESAIITHSSRLVVIGAALIGDSDGHSHTHTCLTGDETCLGPDT